MISGLGEMLHENSVVILDTSAGFREDFVHKVIRCTNGPVSPVEADILIDNLNFSVAKLEDFNELRYSKPFIVLNQVREELAGIKRVGNIALANYCSGIQRQEPSKRLPLLQGFTALNTTLGCFLAQSEGLDPFRGDEISIPISIEDLITEAPRFEKMSAIIHKEKHPKRFNNNGAHYTDGLIAACAYVLANSGYLPVILTRDKDFGEIFHRLCKSDSYVADKTQGQGRYHLVGPNVVQTFSLN